MQCVIRILCLLTCLATTKITFCQDYSRDFDAYYKLGDFFYSKKEYSKAAIYYSAAIRLPEVNPNISDWERVASCWALGENIDSSFSYLNIISKIQGLTYKFIDDKILTVDDYKLMTNDNRWNEIIRKMYLNAYQTFSQMQIDVAGNSAREELKDTARAIELGLNIESTFLNLNKDAFFYLKKKEFKKAYSLFKVSIDNFPPNAILYQNMSDYYLLTGDKERAFVYFSRKEAVKYYQYLDTCRTCSINIDNLLEKDYSEFSLRVKKEFQTPASLISVLAHSHLRANRIDKAYTLFKTNMALHPNDFLVYLDLASFYAKVGDREKANSFSIRAYMYQFKLPSHFFQPDFNLKKYFNDYDNKSLKHKGKMVFHSEPFFQTLGNFFLANNMYKQAELLFQLCIKKYPLSLRANTLMRDFYISTGNKQNQDEFDNKIDAIKSFYDNKCISGSNILPDTSFNIKVNRPVCKVNCPIVLIHNNGKWKGGLERPFADLLANDGFIVRLSKAILTEDLLKQTNVLVVAGDPLTKEEVDISNNWIKRGGSLFVMTHHDQMDFDNYLNSLGVQTGEINVSQDSLHGLERDGISLNPSYIYFNDKDKLLGKHPIIQGRSYEESIHFVKSFGGGKSIVGPPGCSVILRLSKSAVDLMNIDPFIGSRVCVNQKGERSFGVAFKMGKGKVVVLSSALITTAELFPPDWGKIGMNNPGSDNKQFALNIIRWLTGYLE